MSTIIFLNGSSSAGKTTIAKAIQHLSDKSWLHFGIDTFIDMMSPQYTAFGEKAKDGYFYFMEEENKKGPLIKIENGPLGNKVFETIPLVAKVLADAGNDLIIDEVLFENNVLKKYIAALMAHTVYFVGVYCNLQNMQEREMLRGNRAIGLANGQEHYVHQGIREYDIKVETDKFPSFDIAENIFSFMEKNPTPMGLKKMQYILGL